MVSWWSTKTIGFIELIQRHAINSTAKGYFEFEESYFVITVSLLAKNYFTQDFRN